MLKVTELMIDDWVRINGSNFRVMEIKKKGVIKLYDIVMGWEHMVDFNTDYLGDLLEPIPLTHEILEKNGFTKYDVCHNVSGWTIMDYHYCSIIPFTLTDTDFDTEPWVYKWGPVEDDREESFVREIGRIKYVHELQHALRLCGIEKEIIL